METSSETRGPFDERHLDQYRASSGTASSTRGRRWLQSSTRHEHTVASRGIDVGLCSSPSVSGRPAPSGWRVRTPRPTRAASGQEGATGARTGQGPGRLDLPMVRASPGRCSICSETEPAPCLLPVYRGSPLERPPCPGRSSALDLDPDLDPAEAPPASIVRSELRSCITREESSRKFEKPWTRPVLR